VPASTTAWRPVLEGRDLEFAMRELVDSDGALRGLEPVGNPSLSRGEAGLGLLWTYLGRAGASPKAFDRARVHMDRAVESLEDQILLPSLYPGFVGIAWVRLHVERHLYGESDIDSFQEIDEALIELLELSPWTRDFDLVSGLVGIGVYLLERDPVGHSRRALELLLNRLIESSTRVADGVTWHTPARLLHSGRHRDYPDGYTALGVAHGVAGVIPILAGMVGRGIGGDHARALLDDAFTWLMAQQQPEESPAMFANFAGERADPVPSRLAWCYGDAGMAATLCAAADLAGHDEMRAAATRAGLRAAARDLRNSGIRDAGLCHGCAGVAHLFNRLFQRTGDERFREASLRWFASLPEWKRPSRAKSAYPVWDPDYTEGAGWRPEAGLLEGSGGVALALHAAISEVEPLWDRFLLLSIAEPR